MMFKRRAAPVIDMGGLYLFECSEGLSAPSLIEDVLQAAVSHPNEALPQNLTEALARLVSYCLGGRRSLPRAFLLIDKAPDAVARALRQFLEDPLPQASVGAADGAGGASKMPSVLDMRSAWLASGGGPDIFDRLTLWEHSRILKERQKRQRAALLDAAVSARMGQADNKHFKRFVADLSADLDNRAPNAWVRSLFAASAHLPTVTQQDLASMKGTA